MFRAVIASAGLTICEGVRILGITRPTFYKWEKGVQPRVRIQYRAACQAAKLLEEAVRQGRLPLKDGSLTSDERLSRVVKIMQEIRTA